MLAWVDVVQSDWWRSPILYLSSDFMKGLKFPSKREKLNVVVDSKMFDVLWLIEMSHSFVEKKQTHVKSKFIYP